MDPGDGVSAFGFSPLGRSGVWKDADGSRGRHLEDQRYERVG
jgi:hypothetical protein